MAGANRIHHPRKGSMQFWHRVRAKRIYPRINNWPKIDATKLLGFIGYKAGMTHILIRDNFPTSHTKGMQVSMPVTVVECPPLKVSSFRLYKKTHDGFKVVHDSVSKKQEPSAFDDVRIVVKSQPNLTGSGKKHSEVLEIPIGGKVETKLQFAKGLIGKDIKASEIFKEGQFLDFHAVTKGKGMQGTVKRFGVKIRKHKSEKTKRGVGTLGPWQPKKVSWRVAQPGKMGFHTRTEYNKWLMRIGNDPKLINPKGGFLHYGLVKNEYLLIKGSVPGPVKRTIIFTDAIRPVRKPSNAEIVYVSQESKQ